MEQMAKLSVFIFALLTRTNYSCEFIIKTLKNASKFAEYFKMHLKCIF